MKWLNKFIKSNYEIKIFILAIIIFTFFIIGSTVYAYWFLNNQKNIHQEIDDKCML
jgi:hypothetical protein